MFRAFLFPLVFLLLVTLDFFIVGCSSAPTMISLESPDIQAKIIEIYHDRGRFTFILETHDGSRYMAITTVPLFLKGESVLINSSARPGLVEIKKLK